MIQSRAQSSASHRARHSANEKADRNATPRLHYQHGAYAKLPGEQKCQLAGPQFGAKAPIELINSIGKRLY
jgi:hypothetical protein